MAKDQRAWQCAVWEGAKVMDEQDELAEVQQSDARRQSCDNWHRRSHAALACV